MCLACPELGHDCLSQVLGTLLLASEFGSLDEALQREGTTKRDSPRAPANTNMATREPCTSAVVTREGWCRGIESYRGLGLYVEARKNEDNAFPSWY